MSLGARASLVVAIGVATRLACSGSPAKHRRLLIADQEELCPAAALPGAGIWQQQSSYRAPGRRPRPGRRPVPREPTARLRSVSGRPLADGLVQTISDTGADEDAGLANLVEDCLVAFVRLKALVEILIRGQ